MNKFFKLEQYTRFLKKTRESASMLSPIIKELEYLRYELSRDSRSELQGKFKGKRCFILGNGPSLTLEDIEMLKDEYTFASNKIYLLFNETKWRPTFYSVEDHLVLSQNIDEIRNVDSEYKLFPEHSIRLSPSIPNSTYFNFYWNDVYPQEPDFSKDLEKGLYWGSSIVYTQMQLAVCLGFTEIYLLGVDYSYSVPKTQEDNVMISEGEVNHFHKDYRKPGEKWFAPNLHYHEKSFTKAKNFTESMNVKIYNATRGGKLEIFERIQLEDILNKN